ncbi:MAG: 3'-5' exonuclease [Chitinophagaceae bacterium]|nr:MAG: exonuclease RNase T and DNA polymerase III [Bacteroidetes bacterium OLB11]MCC6447716.1 3'-5' exonuclease [Chitinophagaceae bacterium]HMN32931.1 3'-5' exonuclease [Chitinophagaceae bacterium]
MKLALTNPIACIDLETTGTSITQDRIVEISIVKLFPDGNKEIKTRRMNPTIPIPNQASQVHGIYDDDVKAEPTFRELANGIKKYLENCDLCGFNSNKFDIPILTEEFLRVGIDVDFRERKLVDVQQIFFKKEPRNLSAAYKLYCNKSLENAHSAEADALATLDILEAQINYYDDLDNNIDFLSKFSTGEDGIDYARRLRIVNNVVVFNFGKHKDKSIIEVFSNEPSYYDWIMKGDFALDTKRIISKIYLDHKLKKGV